MLNLSTFLTFHGVDPVRWAKRWDLEPFTGTCRGCGAEQTTTLPIARGKLRGLAAPPCPCGHNDKTVPKGWVRSPPYCVTATDGDLFGAMGR